MNYFKTIGITSEYSYSESIEYEDRAAVLVSRVRKECPDVLSGIKPYESCGVEIPNMAEIIVRGRSVMRMSYVEIWNRSIALSSDGNRALPRRSVTPTLPDIGDLAAPGRACLPLEFRKT